MKSKPIADSAGPFVGVALVLTGVALLAALGAPSRVLIINLVGLISAIVLYVGVRALVPKANAAIICAVIVCALLATALWGPAVDGVHRWVRVGPISLHLGFVLLPLLSASVTRLDGWLPILIMLAAGYALWLQPDGGAAIGLACAALAFAIVSTSLRSIGVAIVAIGWGVATWLKFDPLQPVEFVERVPQLAMSHDLALGVLASLLLAAAPAMFFGFGYKDVARREALWVQGGFWTGAVLASFAGAFPSPLIGGGVGPILGYAVSWAVTGRAFGR